MKWIAERDALIAQTMAFVQSVTGKKDDLHPPEIPMATVAASVQIAPVNTIIGTESLKAAPPLPLPLPPSRVASHDVRTEIQARIANFRKHQERFEREREEYCAATLTRLRAAIREPSSRPPADK
ncbi:MULTISPECIES: hypothetical protein [unclassified Bradyrhizobium]|jgi:hypothetical protein|uniref:hypothetical protein n=1 Tax=unclassified Bradyrhizobium TaxID=2631580 RepID=UPI001FF990F7|nr:MULTISPECIES: hypothetical protein [unclassified Bradyrhizobium]MCK1290848.1 hypothetical protein [Bradyrhizobium sp. 30]MCK1314771.1 hypothetical protein [Bradyrhizobium sp. 23]MCK1509661.1 hypothetical protein [Bradyrhizobium sp. 18]MCK1524733.1 hypothetical protein [Bradyrhizobium sp. 17]MCK1533191.1 hypothetical protein [Bradyrhizobium sp. 176]